MDGTIVCYGPLTLMAYGTQLTYWLATHYGLAGSPSTSTSHSLRLDLRPLLHVDLRNVGCHQNLLSGCARNRGPRSLCCRGSFDAIYKQKKMKDGWVGAMYKWVCFGPYEEGMEKKREFIDFD